MMTAASTGPTTSTPTVIDELSVKYTGEPFALRSGLVFLVEPTLARHFQLPFEAPQ